MDKQDYIKQRFGKGFFGPSCMSRDYMENIINSWCNMINNISNRGYKEDSIILDSDLKDGDIIYIDEYCFDKPVKVLSSAVIGEYNDGKIKVIYDIEDDGRVIFRNKERSIITFCDYYAVKLKKDDIVRQTFQFLMSHNKHIDAERMTGVINSARTSMFYNDIDITAELYDNDNVLVTYPIISKPDQILNLVEYLVGCGGLNISQCSTTDHRSISLSEFSNLISDETFEYCFCRVSETVKSHYDIDDDIDGVIADFASILKDLCGRSKT